MNILLTTVGRRSYMVRYFQNALAGDGKVYVSNNCFTSAMEIADTYVITPDIYDKAYIPFLCRYCSENNISIIIPLFDVDVLILAANKALFKNNGINVIVPSEQVVKICNDKYLTFIFFTKNGFATPKTYISIKNAITALREGEIKFPVIIKPRYGMGSICLFEADNTQELYVLYNKVKRDIFKTYLRYESEAEHQHCVLIQEKINGMEYGLDIINDLYSRYVTTVPKHKITMRAGETDIAKIVNDSRLLNYGKKLSKILGHIGNLDVDCFISGNHIIFLEMNCRFGGQYPFSHEAGVNLPLQLIKWLKGKDTEPVLFQPKEGLFFAKDIILTQLQHYNKELPE